MAGHRKGGSWSSLSNWIFLPLFCSGYKHKRAAVNDSDTKEPDDPAETLSHVCRIVVVDPPCATSTLRVGASDCRCACTHCDRGAIAVTWGGNKKKRTAKTTTTPRTKAVGHAKRCRCWKYTSHTSEPSHFQCSQEQCSPQGRVGSHFIGDRIRRREAMKPGVGLKCAIQAPVHLSEAMVRNVGLLCDLRSLPNTVRQPPR